MRLVDTHAHINFPEFKKDLSAVIERARLNGIIKIIEVGIDRKTGLRALEIRAQYPDLIEVALGFHPHYTKNLTEEDYLWLEKHLPLAVALGEIGLDFQKEYSPKEMQVRHFERLLHIAQTNQKPVLLHLRGDLSFWKFTIDFLKAFKELNFLFHCFTSEREIACKLLDFNSLLSLPGVITFDKATSLREAIKSLPLDRIVLETDCPYLSPVPMRGKRNEPAYLIYTAKCLAEIKGTTLEEIAERTTENALKFFKLGHAGG
ncbi:MAG: TatD family hydrolase [Caldimicrobium sp.]|nr:TatD family hydrolase [Caldimicrobium sp.]MCX7873871.1 TatD family hydrolase [Caldimicrobium sp.]MDW8094748.1 TatD family hydrolase [Caldimicrobium sp.]